MGKSQSYERWLGRNNACVICSYSIRGNLKIEAIVDVPSGDSTPRGGGAYGTFTTQSKTVSTVEAGWKWLREVADEWAKEKGVELYD